MLPSREKCRLARAWSNTIPEFLRKFRNLWKTRKLTKTQKTLWFSQFFLPWEAKKLTKSLEKWLLSQFTPLDGREIQRKRWLNRMKNASLVIFPFLLVILIQSLKYFLNFMTCSPLHLKWMYGGSFYMLDTGLFFLLCTNSSLRGVLSSMYSCGSF